MAGSPAEILAAARLNVVGPYVPAKDKWLTGWQGPARDGEWNVNVVVLESFGPTCLVYGADPTGQDAEWELRVSRLRLDTRRPEVRHLLCDLGIAPEWARKSAVACWCAGMGVGPFLRGPWERFDDGYEARTTSSSGGMGWHVAWDSTTARGLGWRSGAASGPETGDLGRAHADVAALRARCILTEPDGYYVPLADGGIGWWAEVNHAR